MLEFNLTLNHFTILSTLIFSIGIFGVLYSKKSLINLLIAIEIMLLSANINFVAFSAFNNSITGQVFVIFILTVAAVEIAIGLTILTIHYHSVKNIGLQSIENISDSKTHSTQI